MDQPVMDQYEREVRRLLLDDRAQREEAEGAEAELDAARFGMRDAFDRWARVAMVVSVELPGQTVRGRVAHLGKTAVALTNDAGTRVLVDFDAIEGARAQVESGSGPDLEWTTGHPQSMVAMLRELVGGRQLVGIDRRSAGRVSGEVIGVSHEVVSIRTRSGDELIVPIRSVVAVSTD